MKLATNPSGGEMASHGGELVIGEQPVTARFGAVAAPSELERIGDGVDLVAGGGEENGGGGGGVQLHAGDDAGEWRRTLTGEWRGSVKKWESGKRCREGRRAELGACWKDVVRLRERG